MTSTTPDGLRPGDPVDALLGASPLAGDPIDLRLQDGAGAVVDASGWVALAPLADLHAHLDKAYTWTAAGRPEGSLEDAVACWSAFGAHHDQASITANARRQLTAALGAGVTAIRSHVNYHEGDDPLRGVRALVALREEFRGLVDLQVVAMHGNTRPDSLVRDALALGADLIGAAPHLAPDPRLELHRTLDLAEEAGVGVDLHTDETLDPHSLGLLDLARRTASRPDSMPRSAGHCVSLAMQPAARLAEVLDAVAEASLSIVVNPLTNLYLQGWEHPVATPRAIPPLRAILDAGVLLAAGGDNVQDPFNPLGRGDMVEVVASLVLAGHLTPTEAWNVASTGGRRVLGLPDAPGEGTDVLLVRAAHVAEAIAEGAPDRVVVRDGRVTAIRRSTVDVLLPEPARAPA